MTWSTLEVALKDALTLVRCQRVLHSRRSYIFVESDVHVVVWVIIDDVLQDLDLGVRGRLWIVR